jgi:hypothetical protein
LSQIVAPAKPAHCAWGDAPTEGGGGAIADANHQTGDLSCWRRALPCPTPSRQGKQSVFSVLI